MKRFTVMALVLALVCMISFVSGCKKKSDNNAEMKLNTTTTTNDEMSENIAAPDEATNDMNVDENSMVDENATPDADAMSDEDSMVDENAPADENATTDETENDSTVN